jgi:hypothetical protein
LVVIAAVCLLWVTPASAAGGIGIGSGRLIPSVAALVGLMGVVLGGVALSRSAGRIGIAAGVAGLISVIVGGLHSVNSAGGIGTGNGLVAMVGGLISMVLGGLALARSGRTAARLTS